MKEILYGWGGANEWLFHLINDVHSDILDKLMLLGSTLAEPRLYPYYLAVAALGAIHIVISIPIDDNEKARQKGIDWLLALGVLSTSFVLNGFLVDFLKQWFAFPRPSAFFSADSIHLPGPAETSFSLPSAHASFAMVLVASLWYRMNHVFRGISMFFLLWVGISRISLGLHFPADVLAGFLLGYLLVLLINWIIRTVFAPKPHFS